jgi:carbon monoxide dehydrogenase subunit G
MTEITFKSNKDIPSIIQYLTNKDKFVSVHPLIYKMIDLGENNFRVFEKIKVGIIYYRFTYKAHITYNNHSVRIHASVMGLTQLTMEFNFHKVRNETIISEQVTIQSVLPIKNYMTKLIISQHQQMFKNINNV